jgi:hypothetical protein
MPLHGRLFDRKAVPGPKTWVRFGSAALVGLFFVLLLSGQSPRSKDGALPATRGDSSFVVHVGYGNEFEGTCGPFTVTVHFQSAVAGGEPPYRYAWSFGDGGVSSDPNPSHTYTSISVTYTVALRVTDASGAVATDSLGFQPPPPPCAIDVGGGLWVSSAIVVAAIAIPALLAIALLRFRRRKP